MKDKFVPVCKKKCRVWGVGDDGIAPPTVNLDMFYRDENLASRLSSCTHEGSPVALNRRLRAPQPVWTFRRTQNQLDLPGIEPGLFDRPVPGL